MNNNTITNEETIAEDPQVSQQIEKIKSMSESELRADILRHEKEVRGIDWAQLLLDPSLSPLQAREKANHLAKDYLTKLQADLGVADADVPKITREFLSRPFSATADEDVQIMPAWGIDQEEANKWKSASGEELMKMIDFRLKIMQALEISSSDLGYAQLMLSIGVVAWLKRGYDIYKAARAANLVRLAAVVKAIKGVTLQATKLFVATVIVAIIAEIILYLMEKDAVVYMVLLNMTDDDLKKDNQFLVHGKQTVQFINPMHETLEDDTLLKRTYVDLGDGEVEANYWIGLYSAQKKYMALYGSQGAFRLAKCNSFPDGAYVGWDIPLSSVIGGTNKCLVSAQAQRNTEAFSYTIPGKGSLFSTSQTGKAKIVGKMHSGSGSKGYMSVIFEKLS